ncbi:hypothetical protein [Umezawaea beigongshangensis]|uniref:hypothetical protein n=1 Tax=Umezawaea beigongshangensis TaxID=2780383 RepID=UPI0018F19E0B|nr:hypothetical protein [Umezawaea beigongshangensis]
MKTIVTLPVNRRSISTAVKAVPVTLAGIAVMWFAFGIAGAVVLTLVLFFLGRLLLRAARSE